MLHKNINIPFRISYFSITIACLNITIACLNITIACLNITVACLNITIACSNITIACSTTKFDSWNFVVDGTPYIRDHFFGFSMLICNNGLFFYPLFFQKLSPFVIKAFLLCETIVVLKQPCYSYLMLHPWCRLFMFVKAIVFLVQLRQFPLEVHVVMCHENGLHSVRIGRN